LGAFCRPHARATKPGFPLQSFLPLRGKKGFPLQSLAHAQRLTNAIQAAHEEKIHHEVENWQGRRSKKREGKNLKNKNLSGCFEFEVKILIFYQHKAPYKDGGFSAAARRVFISHNAIPHQRISGRGNPRAVYPGF
jgi:hypothetical protein